MENPTKEDVEKYHKIYIQNLENLYEKYKNKYSKNPDEKLCIY